MSKTISEVQTSKCELERKITAMLADFEKENGVEVSSVYCSHYEHADEPTPSEVAKSPYAPPHYHRVLTFLIHATI